MGGDVGELFRSTPMTLFLVLALACLAQGAGEAASAGPSTATKIAVANAAANTVHTPAVEAPAGPASQKMDVTLATLEKNGDNLPFPGIDWLGVGYDIVKGNPGGDENSLLDPGYRIPVAELKWDQDKTTRDVRDLQPTNGYAFREIACARSQKATTSSSMEDYQEEANIAVGIDGEYDSVAVSGSFSASYAANEFQKSVVEGSKEKLDITSYCVKFKAGFNKAEVVVGTDYFRQQAKALPILKPTTCPDSELANCVVLYSSTFKQYVSYEDSSSNNPKRAVTLKKTNDDSTRWVWNMKSPTLNKKTKNPQSVLVHAKSGLALSVNRNHELTMVPRDAGDIWERTMDGSSFRCVSCKKNKKGVEKLKPTTTTTDINGGGTETDKTAKKKKKVRAKGKPMPYVLAVFPASEGEKIKMDGNDKLKLKAMKPDDYAKLNAAVRGRRTVLDFVSAEAETEQKWSDFFNEFGTHFIATMKLGGKLVHSTVMSQEDSETMDQSGWSAAAAVEVATASFSGGVHVEGGKQKESMTKFSKMEKTEKTTVLGGNPPPSGAEDQAGFAEWAETVTDAPMPVKITLRPLSAVGGKETAREHFSHTFDVMVAKYMSNTIARSKADYFQAKWAKKEGASLGLDGEGGSSSTPPTLTPGGPPLTSDGKPFLWNDYSLVLNKDGALQIKNHKLNQILWDSLVTDYGRGHPAVGTKLTPGGPYRLQYQTDGNLVIMNKRDQMIWQSQTKVTTCGGNMPKKVEFDGDLAIFTEGSKSPVWHAGTKKISETAAKSKAKRAAASFFGGGKNTCITAENCVKLFYKRDFTESDQDQKSLAPGSYSEDQAMPNFVGDVNSIKVFDDNCWYRSWNEEDFTDETDFATTSVDYTTDGWVSKAGNRCPPHVDDDIYAIRVFRRWDVQMVEAFGNAVRKPDGVCKPSWGGILGDGDEDARAAEMKARLLSTHPNWEGDFLKGPVPQPP